MMTGKEKLVEKVNSVKQRLYSVENVVRQLLVPVSLGLEAEIVESLSKTDLELKSIIDQYQGR